jgi:hypothetical protein
MLDRFQRSRGLGDGGLSVAELIDQVHGRGNAVHIDTSRAARERFRSRFSPVVHLEAQRVPGGMNREVAAESASQARQRFLHPLRSLAIFEEQPRTGDEELERHRKRVYLAWRAAC